MTERKDDEKDAADSPDALHWKTSAAKAHSRDERAQAKDIDRKSDKTPDDAEAGMSEGEAEAHRMRLKNEA